MERTGGRIWSRCANLVGKKKGQDKSRERPKDVKIVQQVGGYDHQNSVLLTLRSKKTLLFFLRRRWLQH